MRYTLIGDGIGAIATLTDEPPASLTHPVLLVHTDAVDGCFTAEEAVPLPGGYSLAAADIVQAWAMRPGRSDDEIDAATRFLGHPPAPL